MIKKDFFKKSRSPKSSHSKGTKDDKNNITTTNTTTTNTTATNTTTEIQKASKDEELKTAFENYEKIMARILKTPPQTPASSDSEHNDENEQNYTSNLNDSHDKIENLLPLDNQKPDIIISFDDNDNSNNNNDTNNNNNNENDSNNDNDNKENNESDNISEDNGFCAHQNVLREGDVIICEDCGIELYQEISHKQDWRYYGEQDSRNTSDPSRCQFRKCSEKGIKKDLEKMGFPSEICELADQLYLDVTKGEVKRNLLRKGVMFACVFEAFKFKHKPKTPDEIQTRFGIDNKSASQGISFYRQRCPREHFQYEDIDAKHFIPEIMKKFNTKENHIKKVTTLYEKIKDSCDVLHRSNPKSVSKALVFYYLRRKGCNISSEKYGKIVSLSEAITIRLSSEISRILGTQDSVNLF